LLRDCVESAKEVLIVALVDRESRILSEAGVFCITRGADAERRGGVDLETGIVGEDGVSWRVERVIDGFGEGVALEGGLVFGRRGDGGETGERFKRNVRARDFGCCGEVAELARVGGGDVEDHLCIQTSSIDGT